MKECPSCGAVITENVAFCPACGTKINTVTPETNISNTVFENVLARVETKAKSVLNQSRIMKPHIDDCELEFSIITNAYPTEPKVYLAHVNFWVEMINRAISPQSQYPEQKRGDYCINDFPGLIRQLDTYLDNATKYNKNNDSEITQEIMRLKGYVESIKMNPSQLEKFTVQNEKDVKFHRRLFLISLIVGLFVIVAGGIALIVSLALL